MSQGDTNISSLTTVAPLVDELGRYWHGGTVPGDARHELEAQIECTLLASSMQLLRQLEGMGCRAEGCLGKYQVMLVDVSKQHGGGSFLLECGKCSLEERFATGTQHYFVSKPKVLKLAGFEGSMLILGQLISGALPGQIVARAKFLGIPGITDRFVYELLHALEPAMAIVAEESCELVYLFHFIKCLKLRTYFFFLDLR